LFVFKGPGVWTCRASKGRAQVATVGADETNSAGAKGVDVELSGPVGHVVALTSQQIVEPPTLSLGAFRVAASS
jgi:hypothetical protein